MKCIKCIILLLFYGIGFGSAQKITVSGTSLLKDGKEIWFNGVNTPWDKWNDFGGNYNPTWWDAEFARLKDAKINLTRIWISCDGGGQPSITNDGFVTGVNQKFWDDVDHLASLATKYEIYVLPTMISFDHTRDGTPKVSQWRKMYYSDENIQSYLDNYLIPFVKRYDHNPYFFSIDIANEIEWIIEDASRGKIPLARVQKFVAMCSAAIHKNSSMLTGHGSACIKWNSDAGGPMVANWWSDAAMMAANDNDTTSILDIWHVHYYKWQLPWFGAPFTKTAQAFGIPRDRPCLVGEAPARGESGYTMAQMYENTYLNGFVGYCGWTSNGVDVNGNLSTLSPGTTCFFNKRPHLVYPGSTFTMSELIVNNGSGSGTYVDGATISISADPAPAGKVFDKWMGSTGIANENLATTTIIITPGPITVSATYKEMDTGNPPGIDNSSASMFDIYPNPASDKFTISLPKDVKNAQVFILSLDGKILKQADNMENGSVVNLNGFNTGLYLVRVTSNNRNVVLKCKIIK